MNLLNQKKQIFGAVGALNAINDSFPKLPTTNSLGSINNNTDSTEFLVDLINTLVGVQVLKEYIVDVITYRLPEIEDSIKDGLKKELKKIVSCNINPSIPDWVKHGGSGVVIKVSDIDFYNMMKINPDSIGGSLLYTDISSGINSSDFNTYLYNTIQVPGASSTWGQSTSGVGIIETTFMETSNDGNNLLKITATPEFSDKKLTELNNKLIDSISLFGNPNSHNSKTMINMIIEQLFGTISSSTTVNKGKNQIRKEVEINEILTNIINSEDDDIDDTYFEFDNPTLSKIDTEVNDKKEGIKRIQTTNEIKTRLSTDILSSSQTSIDNTTNKMEELEAVGDVMNKLANEQSGFALNVGDEFTIENNFFTNIIKTFTLTVMNIVFSPKFITLFAINHQIIYGTNDSYNGPIDFIKKNRLIVKAMTKVIKDILLGLLLELALKHLTIKLSEKMIGDEIERNKSYANILLSYTKGVTVKGLDELKKL